ALPHERANDFRFAERSSRTRAVRASPSIFTRAKKSETQHWQVLRASQLRITPERWGGAGSVCAAIPLPLLRITPERWGSAGERPGPGRKGSCASPKNAEEAQAMVKEKESPEAAHQPRTLGKRRPESSVATLLVLRITPVTHRRPTGKPSRVD
ncbi:MAG: hypothetical protein AAGI37_21025, partial [Planctomycetota bacterium]